MKCFFVDAETDGLYGDIISIAAIVVERKGKESDVFSGKIGGLSKDNLNDQWTKENVLPLLDDSIPEYQDLDSMLDGFWEFWIKHKDNSICIADVQYPIEANLFRKCVEKDIKNRIFMGPYPLYDLSTMLYSNNIDPSSERLELIGENSFRRHNPLDDCRITAQIWRKLDGRFTV